MKSTLRLMKQSISSYLTIMWVEATGWKFTNICIEVDKFYTSFTVKRVGLI